MLAHSARSSPSLLSSSGRPPGSELTPSAVPEAAPELAGAAVADSASACESSRISSTASKSSLDSWRAFAFSLRLRRCVFFNSFAKRFLSSRNFCCSAFMFAMSPAKLDSAPFIFRLPEIAMALASACTEGLAGRGLSATLLATPSEELPPPDMVQPLRARVGAMQCSLLGQLVSSL